MNILYWTIEETYESGIAFASETAFKNHGLQFQPGDPAAVQIGKIAYDKARYPHLRPGADPWTYACRTKHVQDILDLLGALIELSESHCLHIKPEPGLARFIKLTPEPEAMSPDHVRRNFSAEDEIWAFRLSDAVITVGTEQPYLAAKPPMPGFLAMDDSRARHQAAVRNHGYDLLCTERPCFVPYKADGDHTPKWSSIAPINRYMFARTEQDAVYIYNKYLEQLRRKHQTAITAVSRAMILDRKENDA